MPCGGIYPLGTDPDHTAECYACGELIHDAEMLSVIEWDAVIHKSCLREFLGTEEGKIIREHQHPIITEVRDGGGYTRLLAYAPELSQSDWAECATEWDGFELVLNTYSRVEYE